MEQAGIGPGRRNAADKPAEFPQLAIPGQFAPQAFHGSMLKDDAGDKGIPHRPHRIIVAAASAAGLQDLHQWFVGQHVKNPMQSL